MSKYTIIFTCHEILLDSNDDFVEEITADLPHEDIIVKTFCDQWNKDADDFLLEIANQDCDNAIESCKMRKHRTNNGETSLAIDFIIKQGRRLTTKLRYMISDFTEIQMVDGWGEGMFGYANIMEAPDGTKFMVE